MRTRKVRRILHPAAARVEAFGGRATPWLKSLLSLSTGTGPVVHPRLVEVLHDSQPHPHNQTACHAMSRRSAPVVDVDGSAILYIGGSESRLVSATGTDELSLPGRHRRQGYRYISEDRAACGAFRSMAAQGSI